MVVSAFPRNKFFSSGQALLFVLLGMAVVLTVVISVVSTSIVDVSVTETEEESFKAFSAAEAGIENFLSSGITSGGLSESGASFNVESSDLASGNVIDFGDIGSYRAGDVATVWFVSHQDDESFNMTCSGGKPCFNGSVFDLCWGSDPNDKPAVELLVFYGNRSQVFSGNFSSVRVKRYVFDPVAGRSEGFASVGGGCLGYNHSASISDLPSGLLFARVRFLYNTAPQSFAVQAASMFPSQGRIISSLGTAGQASRRVEMIEMYREPASFLDAGLVSLTDILKE